VPTQVKSVAYMEGHVPLACNQEMLSPLQEANILQTLNLQGHERVLEIGTGTGFLTTMLAMQAGEVISCEIHTPLAQQGKENIDDHGASNATVIEINAMDANAIASHADLQNSFDAIVLTAAVQKIPTHLEALLKEDGQIMAFIGSNPVLSLIHKRKVGAAWQQTGIFETLLQDMEGSTLSREFVF
ncbi:MAG: rRNA adenine N-6-methyltransferase family protein, partial [Mariprofundaceae bacterium]